MRDWSKPGRSGAGSTSLGPALITADSASKQDSCLCFRHTWFLSGFSLAFSLFSRGHVPGSSLRVLSSCSFDAKGAPIMTMVSLTDCCRLLVIDPKTLRRWLSHCGLSTQPHPLDARCKCVTREQVEQLAAVHRRTLADQEGLHVHPETSALSTPGMSAPVLSDVLPDFS